MQWSVAGYVSYSVNPAARKMEIQPDKLLEVPGQQRRTDDGELFQKFQEEHLVHDRKLRERKKRDTAAKNPASVHADTSSALLGKEINHRGPATFPFGETLFLRAVISQQIQQDMSEKDPANRRSWWSGFEKWDLPDVGLDDRGRETRKRRKRSERRLEVR
ncbi:MAG: hypothetical protein Q9167_007035 [Letrouitia subvulpina]